MFEELQTTIRILVIAAAGVAAIAIAGPQPAAQGLASAADAPALLSLGKLNVVPAVPRARPSESAGFALFCEDRR